MAKKENNLALGISEPEKVDAFMQTLDHPLKEIVIYLRQFIMSIDKNIGEGIYWNAPTFYYTGENAIDKTNILEGDYADGRRLATFNSIDDVIAKEKSLEKIIKQLLKAY